MTPATRDRPGPVTKLLGVFGIVGGVALLVGFLPGLPWTHELFTLRLVSFNAGAMAVAVAVHRRQAPIARRLSLAVVGAVVVANAWYLVMDLLSIGRPVYPEPDPAFRQVFLYAGVALWLADAAFGFAAWHIGVVTRWGALALGVGSLLAGSGIGGLWFTTGPLAAVFAPASLIGIALVGIGWILLGADLAMGHGRQPRAAAITAGSTT